MSILQERHPDIKASRHLKITVREREHRKVLKGKFAETWEKKYCSLQNSEKIKYPLQNKTPDEGSGKIFGFTLYFPTLKIFFHQAVRHNQRSYRIH